MGHQKGAGDVVWVFPRQVDRTGIKNPQPFFSPSFFPELFQLLCSFTFSAQPFTCDIDRAFFSYRDEVWHRGERFGRRRGWKAASKAKALRLEPCFPGKVVVGKPPGFSQPRGSTAKTETGDRPGGKCVGVREGGVHALCLRSPGGVWTLAKHSSPPPRDSCPLFEAS